MGHLSWIKIKLGQKDLKKVEVELDALVVVKKIYETMKDYEANGQYIKAIQELIKRDWECYVNHTLCETNQCVDYLAHIAFFYPGLQIFEVPPENIYSKLLADSLGVTRHRDM
ncbi:hypothetical protein REPUB_Repub09cG0181900 [Reevesia pubescens]